MEKSKTRAEIKKTILKPKQTQMWSPKETTNQSWL
jgi:hypothetical protein